MDQLFTINVTPDETAHLHNAFQSSNILKVDWDENQNTADDEIISVYLDSITEQDAFEMAAFKNKEHAEQCKNIRKNIREYIFTCFKNDGILQLENKSKKEEMNNFLKNNEGALKINLKKKKLVRIIEPLYSTDRQRNNRADVEENRYYSKEAEEEARKRERETEEKQNADEKFEKNGFRKKNSGEEDDENVYELFEEMMNKTLQEEAPVVSDQELDTLIKGSLSQTEKKNNSEERNVKSVNQEKLEIQISSVDSSIKNEMLSETHTTIGEMTKAEIEKGDTYDEIKDKESTINIQDNKDAKEKDGQTENLKKRKIHRIGETENKTDEDVEEIEKKGKIVKKKNCVKKENNKSNHNFDVSEIVLSEFRKQIKEWVTFFPNINVGNFFFHLYFLVELWKNKKKACVHCGSTDCDFDEYNKSVCKNLNCFLCKKKLMEGAQCHPIRRQFNIMRTYLTEYTQNSQVHHSFDQFGAACFVCFSSKHQICGIPPNVEGAKTIDFRAFRIYEGSLWRDVYSNDPLFIWDTENEEYYRKRDLVMSYLNEKRTMNKKMVESFNPREEEECQTRMYAHRTGAGYKAKNNYGEEKGRMVFFEEQQQSKWNETARGDRFGRHDQNERREYSYTSGGKNRNYNEPKWSLTDYKGNQNSNSNSNGIAGVNINYKRIGEKEYSKNNNLEGHNTYHTDINNRRRVNFSENKEWQDYNTKQSMQHDTNEHVAKNIQTWGQTAVYRNPYFYNTENGGEHPMKEKKWNYSKKKTENINTIETVNKNSKHRVFSSSSGKHSQNIYAGSAHTYDRDVRDNRIKQDQRYNERTPNFNKYSASGPYFNVQRGPSPLYKNVDASSERSFDQYFYKRNKNEKNFAGITGSEMYENRARGIYSTHQNTGRYMVKPNSSGGNCYTNNANVNSYNSNTSHNKTGPVNSGYKGKTNDRNVNYNTNHSNRGNKNTQKNENNFRYNNNNNINKGDNNESFYNNNTRNMYRTKSTGSKPN